MNNDNEKRGKEKKILNEVLYLNEYEKKVHIITNEKRFYNGFIIDFTNSYLLLDDRIKGLIKIIYSDIYKIEEYKKQEGGKWI